MACELWLRLVAAASLLVGMLVVGEPLSGADCNEGTKLKSLYHHEFTSVEVSADRRAVLRVDAASEMNPVCSHNTSTHYATRSQSDR